MTTDLDKYGLVALTIIVVLILFIAIHDLNEQNDPDIKRVQIESVPPDDAEGDGDEAPLVLLQDESPEAEIEDFDFMEEPVRYPGSPDLGPAEAPPAATGAVTHKVRSGDTLTELSIRYYGSARYWRAIMNANPGVNPNALMVGEELMIPAGAAAESGTGRLEDGASPPAKGKVRFYKVKRGDTLVKIAQALYGRGADWRKIYTANRKWIPDPKKLKIGTRLEIPR